MTTDQTVADSPAADQVKPVVGMIHVGALPGTPRHHRSLPEIVEEVRAEARLYQEAGVNCLMIENMPAQAVRAEVDLPIGVQLLAAADIEALAVAHAAGLDFIRTECFAFAHVADEGIMESNAAKLLRYRRAIGATAVQVWADIKKKHSSHAWTADLSLGDVAEAAEFMGADPLIVTGASPGRPPPPTDVEEARARCQWPVFVGSGVTLDNAADFLAVSDGMIIGSYFKRDGNWSNGVDPERVRAFMAEAVRWQPGAGQPPDEFVPPVVLPRGPGSTPRIAIPPFPQQPRQ